MDGLQCEVLLDPAGCLVRDHVTSSLAAGLRDVTFLETCAGVAAPGLQRLRLVSC